MEEKWGDYINNLLAIFCEVKRILKPSGSFWLKSGDAYQHKSLDWYTRRHFLRSLLPGTLALGILSVQEPARAEKTAKALVLSCIDFRPLEAERYFLSMQNLGNQYDWTALSGASLALAGFPRKADTEAFWDQLDFSYQLHHIQKVIILDHQDCGAFASKVDPELSKDPEREQQVHADYLNRAYRAIRQRYPELNIELYFVSLNAEVKPIAPVPLP